MNDLFIEGLCPLIFFHIGLFQANQHFFDLFF